jgi:site-specific DNA-methyltransferase (adenine-specific)
MAKRSKIHMTPKPIELLENIIKHTTDENDILLDCFAGTGSLGLACKNTGRKCILIEKEKKYYDYIVESLELNK